MVHFESLVNTNLCVISNLQLSWFGNFFILSCIVFLVDVHSNNDHLRYNLTHAYLRHGLCDWQLIQETWIQLLKVYVRFLGSRELKRWVGKHRKINIFSEVYLSNLRRTLSAITWERTPDWSKQLVLKKLQLRSLVGLWLLNLQK